MTRDSSPELLTLHAVRVLGFADSPAVARRFDLEPAEADEALEDAQARGWVTHSRFADLSGWSLTDAGRAENERQLAAELAAVGAEAEVHAVLREFLPLNARLLRACTDWQMRPTPTDPLAVNDHTDPAWDADVLVELEAIARGLAPLARRLEGVLPRFRGYDTRFRAALRRAGSGQHGWVDRTDLDSCHRVWFELHEDLLATLGIARHPPPRVRRTEEL
ncbi:transcriptional regulator [Cellulomonas sp.]|uniref:transcriptional regulator n=1 Tax=Cellulomonas sp. TaxID=40001 RepID=UPI00281113DD|nr:transcriptional regulator [Cellulomonas sp.]